MIVDKVYLPFNNELLEDAEPAALAVFIEKNIAWWCTNHCVQRLEGPCEIQSEIPDLFIRDQSALVWPVWYEETGE